MYSMRNSDLCLHLKSISQYNCLPSHAGDELLEVNGESLQGLTHQQAIQTFKVDCMFAVVFSL